MAARRNPDSKSPDADYIAGMRKLIAAYPDDLEAKSILGLALLDGYDPVTKAPRTNTVEGTTLLHEVIAKDDNHFGAHHYLIHGWEGSTTPEKAWLSCKRYPELVPNIPHALHMPGHIFAQSDRIDDAVKSFADAADNELKWLGADVLYPNGHHGHNVHFLVHALNLDGRFKDSMERVRHIMSFKETPRERAGNNQRTPYRQGYYSLVKTIVRFERWDLVLDATTIPVYDKPEQHAWRTWAIGLAYAAQGKLEEARTAHAQMKQHLGAVTALKRPLTIAEMELDATIAARARRQSARLRAVPQGRGDGSGPDLHRTSLLPASRSRGPRLHRRRARRFRHCRKRLPRSPGPRTGQRPRLLRPRRRAARPQPPRHRAPDDRPRPAGLGQSRPRPPPTPLRLQRRAAPAIAALECGMRSATARSAAGGVRCADVVRRGKSRPPAMALRPGSGSDIQSDSPDRLGNGLFQA